MSNYYVTATTRERDCDRNAAIQQLVLDQSYLSFKVHPIEKLKSLADQKRLYSICPKTLRSVAVEIYWSSYYQRWIATTDANRTACDNLLSKPIYRATNNAGTTVYYDSCAI